ncbi:MAG TPA: hypothetical protein VKF16_06200 [Candidatus Dormibacteraeota bacterium]|nr:hypothetical protein [Candidatus Dormibacteraeota bacterium]
MARNLSRATGRRFVGGQDILLWPAGERLKGVVEFSEVVGQLDHLEAEPAGPQAFCGQHDQRLD